MDEQEYELFKTQVYSNPDMAAQIEAMPPDAREEYIRNLFRDYTGESEILNEQVAQADALRNTGEPKGRYTNRAYTAANPLEHLNAGIKRVKGQFDYDKAMGGKEAMSADKTNTQMQTGEFMRPQTNQDNYISLNEQAGQGRYMVDEATDEMARKQLEQAKLLRMYGAPT